MKLKSCLLASVSVWLYPVSAAVLLKPSATQYHNLRVFWLLAHFRPLLFAQFLDFDFVTKIFHICVGLSGGLISKLVDIFGVEAVFINDLLDLFRIVFCGGDSFLRGIRR